MNICTVRDVAGALDVLPALPLDNSEKTENQRATGTYGDITSLAPQLAPKPDKSGASKGIADKSTCVHTETKGGRQKSVSADSVNIKQASSITDNALLQSGRQDLNLRPLRPERSALAKLSYSPVTVLNFYNKAKYR